MDHNAAETARRRDSFNEWVTELVHRHRARLAGVVRREGVRSDDTLDCVQEAFLSFLGLPQARLLVGQPADSAKMLSILARNIVRNRRRRHNYSRPHVTDEAVVESVVSDATPVDENTLFGIGSNTKAFTSGARLLKGEGANILFGWLFPCV